MLTRFSGFAIAAGTTTTAGQSGGDANKGGNGQRQAEGALCIHGFRAFLGEMGGGEGGVRLGCSRSWDGCPGFRLGGGFGQGRQPEPQRSPRLQQAGPGGVLVLSDRHLAWLPKVG